MGAVRNPAQIFPRRGQERSESESLKQETRHEAGGSWSGLPEVPGTSTGKMGMGGITLRQKPAQAAWLHIRLAATMAELPEREHLRRWNASALLEHPGLV